MDKKDFVELNQDNMKLDFMDLQDDILETEHTELKKQPYKIIISDDDEEVHRMTKLVLKGFQMEGIGLTFLDAYSEKESIVVLKNHPVAAIILLDVVMEDNESGLRVV